LKKIKFYFLVKFLKNMNNITNNIIYFFSSPGFKEGVLISKIVFWVLGIAFLIGIIFFLIKSTWLRRLIIEDLSEFFTYRPYGAKKIYKTWMKIMARADTGLESEYKLALIEADSMLDDTLKRMGYAGETVGERLEKINSAILPNIEEVWQAHKTRNNIVHDPDYKLTLDEAKKNLSIYEQAFRELQLF